MRSGWVAFLLLAAVGARAAPLFDDDTVLEATLSGPLSELVAASGARSEYPFVLAIDGTEIPVMVRVRGNSRLRVCEFPPLRLNFSSKTTGQSLFEGQDKLKLVTHCSERRRDAANIFDEYAAYRLFNLISPYSYKVQALKLRYTDTAIPGAQELRPAFLIESDENFAARHELEALEAPGVYLSKLDRQQAARVYVFQYMIGNTDWSLVTANGDDRCCHNIDLFENAGRTLPVPYDFDLAGIVDASYAKPDPGLKIRSVRSRLYRGYCIDRESLARALDEIVERQTEILDAASNDIGGSAEAVEDRRGYLEEFFEHAQERDELLRKFEKRCL